MVRTNADLRDWLLDHCQSSKYLKSLLSYWLKDILYKLAEEPWALRFGETWAFFGETLEKRHINSTQDKTALKGNKLWESCVIE